MDNQVTAAAPFVNKVEESGILTFDLGELYPKSPVIGFDIKDYLFMGMILKEKDFREALKALDLNDYSGKIVGVHCSADAIVPVWAFMLAASTIQQVAVAVYPGTPQEAAEKIISAKIALLDTKEYEDKRVVIKGCGEYPVSHSSYLEITAKLRPVAKSIMYGEPCSTVPIYKRKG